MIHETEYKPEGWDEMSSIQKNAIISERVFGKTVKWIKVLEAYGYDPETYTTGEESFDSMIPITKQIAVIELEDGSVAYWNPTESEEQYVLNLVPSYMTDMSSAWDIVRHMHQKLGWNFTLHSLGVVALFDRDGIMGDADQDDLVDAKFRDPMPEVIALAALRALHADAV